MTITLLMSYAKLADTGSLVRLRMYMPRSRPTGGPLHGPMLNEPIVPNAIFQMTGNPWQGGGHSR